MYRRLGRCLLGSIFIVIVVCASCLYYVFNTSTSYSVKYPDIRKNDNSPIVLPLAKPRTVHVVILFTKASKNEMMKMKLINCVKSLLEYASVRVHFHVIGDELSRRIAARVFSRVTKLKRSKLLKVNYHAVEEITEKLNHYVRSMQEHFSYKPGAYYSDSIFFLSLFLHLVLNQDKVIMLDVDIQFKADVLELYREFDKFGEEAIVGIAYEQQPVYRHVFQLYRMNHSEPKIGEPQSTGFPGFNSGVLLLHLEKMRRSEIYAKLLNDTTVDELVQKYFFRGHLGDQDFFTLVALVHMELFHILSCGWNRQLCQWWRNHGYEDIFDLFYKCDDPVKIYHGNCNTPIYA